MSSKYQFFYTDKPISYYSPARALLLYNLSYVNLGIPSHWGCEARKAALRKSSVYFPGRIREVVLRSEIGARPDASFPEFKIFLFESRVYLGELS